MNILIFNKILLILILFSLSFSFAQNNNETYKEVQVKSKIKIQEERTEFIKNGQSTEVLDDEDLNKNNPAFIEQSLGTMAGVQVDKRTMLGGQRIVIRGYGNDQKFNNWGIKAYLDGMPITNSDGTTNLDNIDFSVINNIEVIKGPAATEYGGGVGGVVRFYTKNSDTIGFQLEQKITVGSYKLFQSQTKADYVTENTSTTLNLGHIETNGYRPHGSSLKNFLTLYSTIKLNEKNKLSIYANHNYSKDQVSGQISYAEYYAGIDNGNPAYIKKNARNEFTSDRFGVNYNVNIKPNLFLNSILFYSNLNAKRVAAGADENYTNQNFGLRSTIDWKKKIASNWFLESSLGTELQQTQTLLSNYRFAGTDDANPLLTTGIANGSYYKSYNNQHSFFTINRITFLPYNLTLILGLSANKLHYKRNDLLAMPGLVAGYNKDISYNKSFNFVYTPHIALQKTYKNQIFNLSYSEGYNAPTASTAFISGINKTNDNLEAEKARMIDFSVQGLFFDTNFDYQFSIFNIDVENKLTQLNGKDPISGTAYTYWANTGNQRNKGLEVSIGYCWKPENSFFKKIEPFINYSNYNFKYTDFSTKIEGVISDFSDNKVVGIPNNKFTLGFDLNTKMGLYLNNTFNYFDDVYTDFANSNKVSGYSQLNSKLGYKFSLFKDKFLVDLFFAGNNLTNEINYTFLFLGNNSNDSDIGSGYPKGVATDVNPGPNKAYFFSGASLKYHF